MDRLWAHERSRTRLPPIPKAYGSGFLAVVILYALVGTTTILVSYVGMGKRPKQLNGFTDQDTPYGPSALTEASTEEPAKAAGDGRASTAVAAVLLLAVVAYAIFGGADFGAGFWDLTAGGA